MDSAALHNWVAAYNWDDGLVPIRAIVDSLQTQHDTALMIYWLLGGPELEGDTSPVNAEAVRLQAVVRERLLAGFYPPGSSRYDPTAELSRVQVYQYRKAGVPDVLLGAENRHAEQVAPPDRSGD